MKIKKIPPEHITTRHASEITGLSISRINELCKSGDIATVQPGWPNGNQIVAESAIAYANAEHKPGPKHRS